MINLKYIITGTGRCGTVYMAKMLTSIGIPCGHESIFDWEGIVAARERINNERPLEVSFVSKNTKEGTEFVEQADWLDLSQIEAESSYLSAPYLKSPIISEAKIIHVVRHPVKVINSFVNYLSYFKAPEPFTKYEATIYQILPELTNPELNPFERAALYYIRWNDMIERSQKVRMRYRIEDPVEKVFDFLNVKPQSYFNNKTENTWKTNDPTRFNLFHIKNDEILRQLIELARHYKYSVSEYLVI